jgi:hypothetical protein
LQADRDHSAVADSSEDDASTVVCDQSDDEQDGDDADTIPADESSEDDQDSVVNGDEIDAESDEKE